MPYIGKAPQLQGAYDKADNIDSQFNSTNTAFSISVSGTPKVVGKSTNLIVNLDPSGVYANRIMLEPETDYTVSGTIITFTTAPASGDHCFIVILGDVGSV